MYVSSACVKHQYINESVEELARYGFKFIELSGGTKYYEGYEDDLLKLKDEYHLEYLLHNYFPPPQKDFILNLASLNDEIYKESLIHCEKALKVSKSLGSKKFGIHAGFLIDFTTGEIGKNIAAATLNNKEQSLKRFCEGYRRLQKVADGVELYIENNVLSVSNQKTFEGQNPLMLTGYDGYLELKGLIDFKLLLDVAHLRVSATSLGLNYVEQLNAMMPLSDYIHISDNDGLHDQSHCFTAESEILNILKAYDLKDKTITMETYGSIADIKLSQAILERTLRRT